MGRRDGVSIPIVPYNMPGSTKIDFSPEQAELARTGYPLHQGQRKCLTAARLLDQFGDRIPDERDTCLPGLRTGAKAAVWGAANRPQACVELYDAVVAGTTWTRSAPALAADTLESPGSACGGRSTGEVVGLAACRADRCC
jgi:dihydrodipicolinate synthase/N-acetylneuraminate lyase